MAFAKMFKQIEQDKTKITTDTIKKMIPFLKEEQIEGNTVTKAFLTLKEGTIGDTVYLDNGSFFGSNITDNHISLTLEHLNSKLKDQLAITHKRNQYGGSNVNQMDPYANRTPVSVTYDITFYCSREALQQHFNALFPEEPVNARCTML